MIKEKLYYIHLTYATFGIITDYYSSIVKDAAPIAKWTIGKSIARVLYYYKNKGADIQILHIARKERL